MVRTRDIVYTYIVEQSTRQNTFCRKYRIASAGFKIPAQVRLSTGTFGRITFRTTHPKPSRFFQLSYSLWWIQKGRMSVIMLSHHPPASQRSSASGATSSPFVPECSIQQIGKSSVANLKTLSIYLKADIEHRRKSYEGLDIS